MKYRARLDIVCSILNALHIGSLTRTRLIYNAYLSYTQVKDYIPYLVHNGLIINIDNTYRITQKGISALHIINQVNEILPPIRLE